MSECDYAEVDEHGRLHFPPALTAALGLRPGSRAKIRRCGDAVLVQRPTVALARLYVEPTTACNLRCRTCIRHVWDEPIGHLAEATFARILEGLTACPDRPTVVFGGLGEPLVHPRIVEMVGAAKATQAQVELITNGTLLDRGRITALMDAGLDALWVSLDGASPECYSDVRVAGDLAHVLANLECFRDLLLQRRTEQPRLGVAFVAMQRNVHELPDILKLSFRLGVREFVITHVYPHTDELLQEILYRRAIGQMHGGPSRIRLARPVFTPETAWMLDAMVRGQYVARLDGLDALWPVDTCPFVLRGAMCVRWDGQVSPCLPLLHRHTSYLGPRLRRINPYFIGSLHEQSLLSLWDSREYVALRRRLEDFDCSPCTACNSCEMADANLEDCFGNAHPTCGGCLWAQGFIRCP